MTCPRVKPKHQGINQANNALANKAFGKSVHILDRKVCHLPVSPSQSELYLQRFPVAIVVAVENVPEVNGQRASRGKVLVKQMLEELETFVP